jgi:hypothetical protein
MAAQKYDSLAPFDSSLVAAAAAGGLISREFQY